MDTGIARTLESLDARSFSFRVEAHGSRWEPLQALRPEGPALRPSDFDVVAVHDLVRDRMRLSWHRTFMEPLTATVHFDEIVDSDKGYISGPDIALGPRPEHPMQSDRLAAVRRQQYLLNPQLLVGDALRRQSATGKQVIRYAGSMELGGVPHGVVEIAAFPRPVRLYVALDTCNVSRLVTQENDFPMGDVEIAVAFSDWRLESGHVFPYMVELSWEGVIIHRETRRRIEVNPQLNPGTFALPATLPFDPKAAERGTTHEQWIHRSLAMGAPIFLDAAKVLPVPIAPDVVTMGGGIHHSLAIALGTEIVVVDSPLHEDRSLAVIDTVNAMWPGKPIKHLILTHHHHDHSGGIRPFASIGAELILAEGDRDFITRCLDRPHTIRPDKLSATATRPAIRTIAGNRLCLGGGAIEIHRIPSPHCAENLIVYVKSAKLLFNADMFNPGLIPPGVPPPPYWLLYSRDFRKQLEALDLDIKVMLGAHGVPEARPYRELIDFTEQKGG